MHRGDQEYIAKIRKYEAETRTLLSNRQKPDRERMVVRAFLRCVGLQCSDDEIQTSNEEPVDVVFRSAQFQVMDILGGRQRGKESLERQRRYEKATRFSNLEEPYSASAPMSFGELSQNTGVGLAKKASRYGVKTCSTLDALVYVDLSGRHLWPLEPSLEAKVADELGGQGWRSVSVLFPPYGIILAVIPSAPDFLKDKVGLILNQWPHPDGLFDA